MRLLPLRFPMRWLMATGVVCLLALSVLLALDGLVFGLRMADPSRGRGSGCFTLLDDLFGTRTPSDALRVTEMLSPLLPLALGAVVIFWRPGRGRHA